MAEDCIRRAECGLYFFNRTPGLSGVGNLYGGVFYRDILFGDGGDLQTSGICHIRLCSAQPRLKRRTVHDRVTPDGHLLLSYAGSGRKCY